jgi:hypothetical protein
MDGRHRQRDVFAESGSLLTRGRVTVQDSLRSVLISASGGRKRLYAPILEATV